MGLLLTELCASPAFVNPGGACAGHLVRSAETAILLDCGFGAAGRLRQFVEPWDLDAVVISHLHADHFIDLVPIRYGLKLVRPHKLGRLPLLVPPGGSAHLAGVGRALVDDPEFFAHEFDLREYRGGVTLAMGDVELGFHPVQHYIPGHALRLHSEGRVLVYSGDAAPCRQLEDAARGAHVLLCESALLDVAEDEPDPSRRGHFTPAEAARLARAAGVERLLLTHAPAGPREERLRAAREAFGGEVEFAEEGRSYAI